jgi:hypothetical protein
MRVSRLRKRMPIKIPTIYPPKFIKPKLEFTT